ncbi:hypothetical protein Psuf_058370 [Phytohabitans suffuscus]|uniref:Aminotransferase class V domain-containing protein n=1 Tax=Phytohabitans suffuscus TaxID=624315 RepID=A0A6F8YR06_9ACTN|nr:hypothetical protein [Phytohabitans suffuscus]BCB88524.1 hypothetical protein Psuf_058370 [Phytohabitans suffuscus]
MELADHGRRLIAEHFGEQAMYSPGADPRLRSPLVAFHPFRDRRDAWNVKKIHEYVTRMEKEHRIWIRWTEFDVPGSPHQHYAARFTAHLFNDHDEIERAVATMVRVAEEMS